MMNYYARFLLFLGLLLLALAGCSGSSGTNTGNPGGPMNDAPGITGSVEAIVSGLCGKIKSCYSGAAEATCKTQIMGLANFTDAMNLNPPYSTLNEMHTAVTDGSFEFNSTSYSTCLSAISGMSCANSAVTAGYSTSAVNNYSGIYRLFQASSHCLTMKY